MAMMMTNRNLSQRSLMEEAFFEEFGPKKKRHRVKKRMLNLDK
jgi:hypothetical protein